MEVMFRSVCRFVCLLNLAGNFETQWTIITGKIDVEAIGPRAQREADHRRERSHAEHHTCSDYTFTFRYLCRNHSKVK